MFGILGRRKLYPYPEYQSRFMRLAYFLVGAPMSVMFAFLVTTLDTVSFVDGVFIFALSVLTAVAALLVALVESARWVGATLHLADDPGAQPRKDDPEVFREAARRLQPKFTTVRSES